MDLLYPKVIDSVACGKDAANARGASFVVNFYRYIDPAPDTAEYINGAVYRIALQEFINAGGHGVFMQSEEGGTLMRDEQGFPKSDFMGGCAADLIKLATRITPLQGTNWNGWMWEQPFKPPKKKLSNGCRQLSPAYRCVLLVFGNDAMSANLSACLLRKRVTRNDPDLSFDVFMDMLQTLRFTEGAAIEPPPK